MVVAAYLLCRPSSLSINVRVRGRVLAVLHTELLVVVLAGGGWRSTVQKAPAVVRGIQDVCLHLLLPRTQGLWGFGCKTACLLVSY